ncbi:hypothetical protein [Piscirickettsia salmonis]
MKKFIELKEEAVQELSATDQTLYSSYPIYYSRGNEESFYQSKDQLIFLLDRIVAENKPALTQLITLKQRLLKLVINDRENNKRLILIGLKKHFESLYYYNRPLLKELPVGQFDDLTLGECYQGVYSNAIMLMDRIIARGGINSYLLSGKRELIQQQAFNFLS